MYTIDHIIEYLNNNEESLLNFEGSKRIVHHFGFSFISQRAWLTSIRFTCTVDTYDTKRTIDLITYD